MGVTPSPSKKKLWVQGHEQGYSGYSSCLTCRGKCSQSRPNPQHSEGHSSTPEHLGRGECKQGRVPLHISPGSETIQYWAGIPNKTQTVQLSERTPKLATLGKVCPGASFIARQNLNQCLSGRDAATAVEQGPGHSPPSSCLGQQKQPPGTSHRKSPGTAAQKSLQQEPLGTVQRTAAQNSWEQSIRRAHGISHREQTAHQNSPPCSLQRTTGRPLGSPCSGAGLRGPAAAPEPEPGPTP